MWVVNYNGPDDYDDHANAVVVDSEGNIYVSGESHGLDKDYDFATIKYNTNGIEQRVTRYTGPANSNDAAYVIDVDGLLINKRKHGWLREGDNPVSLFVEKLDKAAADRRHGDPSDRLLHRWSTPGFFSMMIGRTTSNSAAYSMTNGW